MAISEGALALIGGGLSLAGAFGTTAFNQAGSKKQREWSERMWNAQNAWNLEQWNRQNEYNTPESQVQRLRDAGLNPLYYGVDGIPAASMEAAQPLGYERANMTSFENPMTVAADTAMKLAQIRNVESLTNKTKSETKAIDAKLPYEVDELKSRIRSSNLSSDAQEIVNKYIDRQQEAEIRLKNANEKEAEAMCQKAYGELDKMDYEKTTMFIGWLETREKILTLQKNRDLTDKQMEELSSLIAKNNAEAAKIGLDVRNYDDITVIGNASTTMRFGPFTVQQGEPITLGMKKAAEQHRKELEEKQKNNKKKNGEFQSSFTPGAGNPYQGPIYD